MFVFVFSTVDAMLHVSALLKLSRYDHMWKLHPGTFAGCVDRSLRSINISERNLSAKCEHSLYFFNLSNTGSDLKRRKWYTSQLWAKKLLLLGFSKKVQYEA